MWLKCHLMEIKKNRSTYWNHGRLILAWGAVLSFASTILGFTVRGLLTSIKTWHYVTYQLCLEYYLVWICWTVMGHQWHRSCLIKSLLNDDVHWQNMFFTCKQCSICAGALKSNLLLILWPKLRHNVTKIQRTHQRFNMRLSICDVNFIITREWYNTQSHMTVIRDLTFCAQPGSWHWCWTFQKCPSVPSNTSKIPTICLLLIL